MNTLNKIKSSVVALILVFTSSFLGAQEAATDSTNFCKVSLINGNTITGVLVSQDSSGVVINSTVLGELKVLTSNIESIELVQVGGDYSFTMTSGKVYSGKVTAQTAQNITILKGSTKMGLMTSGIADFNSGLTASKAEPALPVKRVDHGSRYLFAPSAIPLKKGDGYYHNAMLLVNGCHFGVTDNWSVGGGMIFPFGIYGQAKYGRQVAENIHVAGGGMFVTTFFDLGVGLACGFGSVTVGDRFTNATFTMGYGAAGGNGNWNATRRPILNFSAMARLSDNVSLITENYFFPVRNYRYMGNGEYSSDYSYYPQLSAGFRLGGGRHSFDIAAITVGDFTEGDVFAIPFLGYSYRFSNNQ
jgi:hypothetical protein